MCGLRPFAKHQRTASRMTSGGIGWCDRIRPTRPRNGGSVMSPRAWGPGIARTMAPWWPMIGSTSPIRLANTTADDGIRPVARLTLTPRRTASPTAAISRSESTMS